MRNGGDLDAYLDSQSVSSLTHKAGPVVNERMEAKGSSVVDREETTKLRERVKWLEKILGFGRGANHMFEEEIHNLKEKLAILERRLEEEMLLKEEANQKSLALTTGIKAAQAVHKNTEECLRQKVQSLESEVESEKLKQHDESKRYEELSRDQAAVEESLRQQIQCLEKRIAEKDAAAEMQQELKAQASNEEMKRLKRTNKKLLQRQQIIEKELVTCAKGNDSLRGRILTMASEASSKEQTLTAALSQLKSLSESYYSVNRGLKHEQITRHDEVSSLQWSLDDMSCQMLSKKVNELQTENDDLRDELRRQRLEKQRSMAFQRAARGG